MAEHTLSLGAITGRIRNLSDGRFDLHHPLHPKAVACCPSPATESLTAAAAGRWATVVGRIAREPAHGHPIAIRQISAVILLAESEPGAYRTARGAVPWRPGAPLPEIAIRRLRDA